MQHDYLGGATTQDCLILYQVIQVSSVKAEELTQSYFNPVILVSTIGSDKSPTDLMTVSHY